MIREIHLIHHSHTDIGYTHPQPIIFELHRRFIDQALDLADETAGGEEDSKFKWTCEVTGTTRDWWESASSESQERFLAAVGRGQIEVAGMQWHFTPLADIPMLVRSLENVKFFRDLGIPIRSAMNTDVNGVPWGLIEVLLDHGVDGFSMSANSHFGGPVTPRPGAFRWVSPSGRDITVWNGFQYWHVANGLMKLPGSLEDVREAMPKVLREAEERGYPLEFLPIQITCPSHPDNAGPDAHLTQFVKSWNDSGHAIKIKTALLTEEFDLLRQEDLPSVSGDWTDYWNFGAGSSSRETTVFINGLSVVDAAHSLDAWPEVHTGSHSRHLAAAGQSLALYAEHTWGADCSISSPESIETYLQWSKKSAFAYDGLAHARIALRDGLHTLAERAGGEAETLLLYNPLPVPVKTMMRLPVEGLGWALTPAVPHRMRLDSALGNMPDTSKRWCQIDLPPLGYRTYAVSDLPLAEQAGLSLEELAICSDRVRIEFLENGGVRSILVDGIEVVGSDSEFCFGVPVLERPKSGARSDIMKLDFSQFEPADGWNPAWESVSYQGSLVESCAVDEQGTVSFSQTFEMENRDLVTVTYRLFAGDPSIDVTILLKSAGDEMPYSLGLPFVSRDDGANRWDFDTAGAVVRFDVEQLPDSCRHYVTSQHFVRHQGETRGLTIASQNLSLWRFGALPMNYSANLDLSSVRPVTMAWLANNLWEVNFLANQKGDTCYRMKLIPHGAEDVGDSLKRSLPYSVQPALHAYRELGPSRKSSEGLLKFDGADCKLESLNRMGDDLLVIVQNLSHEETLFSLKPDILSWQRASLVRLDGSSIEGVCDSDEFKILPRALVAIRLYGCSENK
jgi:alpha-mannosidase